MNNLKEHKDVFPNLFSAISASTELAIIGISLKGAICGWNPKAAELYGYTAEQVFGKSLKILQAPGHPEVYDKINSIKNNKAYTNYYEISRRRKDGELISLEVFLLPVSGQDRKIIGFVEMAVDVTQKKQIESVKKNYIEELEHRNQTLERFVYMVAHDLKTPLATIKGYSRLLLKEASQKLNDKEQESLDCVIKGIRSMDHLINSLLMLSRETKKSEWRREINLQYLLKNVLQDLEVAINETNGQVKVGQLPNVKGDPPQLYSVFLNLISNALKYNKSDTPFVQITCLIKKEEYRFAVKDNGIGINQDNLERIFDPYERLEVGLKSKGTGLGLALSKKIVESHGGKMWVKSSKRGGSVFYFTLPR
jgi:chemotaxis family two-component system sensor kinase Cph1